MIKILEASTPTCIVVECGGKLTTEDYDAMLEALDRAIAAAGADKPSMVFTMTESPMDADWAAFKDDMRFGTGEYRDLARVAYVGDIAWVKLMVDALGWMTKAENKTFPLDQLDEAIAWANG
jgi:hypothetical protein